MVPWDLTLREHTWTHLIYMIGLDLDWFADCRDVIAVIAVAVVVAIVVADAG